MQARLVHILDQEKVKEWQEHLRKAGVNISFEEFVKFYGAKIDDVNPGSFEMDQIEWIISSIYFYGFDYDLKPIVITASSDPMLAGIVVEGRHRFYAIYLMVIKYNIKIPNVIYNKKLHGIPMPDIRPRSESVNNAKDVYGLIGKYEEMNRSKSERARQKRISDCIENIVIDPPENANLEYWTNLCREHGLADPLYVQKCYERWLDSTKPEAPTNKRNNASGYGGSAGNAGAPGSNAASATGGWDSLGLKTTDERPKGSMPTEVGWTSKRVKCACCEEEYAQLLRVKYKDRVLSDVDIEIKEVKLSEVVTT